jgi:hypothetical protein
MSNRRQIILAAMFLIAAAARGQAQPVVPGSITIGLQPVLNTFSLGFSGVSVPIDMNHPGDGRQYVATNSGHIIVVDGDDESMFLDIDANANVPFTPGFASTLSIAFHSDYLNEGMPGHRKFYTYSSDFKTVGQTSSASTVTPGNQLTGLPDFWHPEMYAPAAGGNPLTDWTNPNSPDSGNTDFDHFNVIREWTAAANGLSIDTSIAPRTVLRMAHGFQGKGSHNGGGFRFGPDGYLYLSTGDGGGNAGQDHDGGVDNSEDGHTDGTGNGQDRTVVYGKVIRIDPTAAVKNSANGQYGIPADNPYVVDNSNPAFLDEIYAYGFRNPWKLNFDDPDAGGDGALYLANVGQHHREEIELIISGGNYGWGYLEGNVRLVSQDSATGEPDPSDLIDGTNGTPIRVPAEGWNAFTAAAQPPLVDYLTRRQTVASQLVGEGTSSVGGFVYRGDAIPELEGMYVFGDYSIAGSPPPGLTASKGRLFYIDPENPSQIFSLQIAFGASNIGQLLGFGDDATGELYAFFDNGNVVRLVGLPPGDFDLDGDVDANDLNDPVKGWKARFGVDLDGDNFLTWQQHLGEGAPAVANGVVVPEPPTAAGIALLLTNLCRRRRNSGWPVTVSQ